MEKTRRKFILGAISSIFGFHLGILLGGRKPSSEGPVQLICTTYFPGPMDEASFFKKKALWENRGSRLEIFGRYKTEKLINNESFQVLADRSIWSVTFSSLDVYNNVFSDFAKNRVNTTEARHKQKFFITWEVRENGKIIIYRDERIGRLA